jgi:divinyl protochlorophyllide a 8-vinyl-reductase
MAGAALEGAAAESGRATTQGAVARIGPNAVTRVAEALTERLGPVACRCVFAAAGLTRHLERPPVAMVPDEDVARLHAALASELGSAEAHAVGAEAGRLTARYLLANRIPRPAQVALGLLPARLALRLLMKAIGRHAWTFAGAGRFSWRLGRHLVLAIEGGPVSRHLRSGAPVCGYYAATFETLFQAIVSPRARVVETACEAQGAKACVFTVRLA